MSTALNVLRAQAHALLEELRARQLLGDGGRGIAHDLACFAQNGQHEEELLRIAEVHAGFAAAATTIGLRHRDPYAAVALALYSFCQGVTCVFGDLDRPIFALPGTPGLPRLADRLVAPARWIASAETFRHPARDTHAGIETTDKTPAQSGLIYEALHVRAERWLEQDLAAGTDSV